MKKKKNVDEMLENMRKAAKERRNKLMEKMAENLKALGDSKFVDPEGGGKGARYFVTTSQKHWLERMEDKENE